MPDSIGPGKRKKLPSSAAKPSTLKTRSRTLAGVSAKAVDELLTRRKGRVRDVSVEIGPCGASAEPKEGEGSDVEWEDEEMYVQTTGEGYEIDFTANAKHKKRTGNVLRLTREEKKRQREIQQVYLLCRFSRGLALDRIADCLLLQGLMLSIVPEEMYVRKKSTSLDFIKKLMKWFSQTFTHEEGRLPKEMDKKVLSLNKRLLLYVLTAFHERKGNTEQLTVIFAAVARALGYQARTVQVLDHVETKKSNPPKKKQKQEEDKTDQMEEDSSSHEINTNPWDPYCWCEIWHEPRHHGSWVHIDPIRNIVDKPHEVESSMRNACITTVVGFYGNGAQDVGPRYMHNIYRMLWQQKDPWWNALIGPYRNIMSRALEMSSASSDQDSEAASKLAQEEEEFSKHLNKEGKCPPRTIDAFRKSPTYILERHITKFKALVPHAGIMGEHKGEPYYLRSDVKELHSVVKWPKQGRLVKEDEIPHPYKIVRKRFQKKRQNDESLHNSDEEEKTELYGSWQTEPWKRPVARDGIVPRNAYGNVELPPLVQDLPLNTTYLDLPNLGPICRKLGVDCAPALVGFEMVKGGRQVPRTQGVVICTEFVQKVTDEFWKREQAREEAMEKEQKEYAKSLWKTLLLAVHGNLKLHQQYVKPQRK